MTVVKILVFFILVIIYSLMFIAGFLAYENKKINQMYFKNNDINTIASEESKNEQL